MSFAQIQDLPLILSIFKKALKKCAHETPEYENILIQFETVDLK